MTDDRGDYLVRVAARHFTAGIVMRGNTCVRAAPILARCIGKDRDYLRDLFRKQGWTATIDRQKAPKI
jgi:hypothetical protein